MRLRIFLALVVCICTVGTASAQIPAPTPGGGSSSGSTASQVVSEIKAATGDNSLLASYLHASCSSPYADSSGSGNNGSSINGVAEPSCSTQGLKYYDTKVGNAWSIPSAVSNNAITYVARVCPYVSSTGNNNGSNNQDFLQSTSTSGLNFGMFGVALNFRNAYAPMIGSVSSYNTTYTADVVRNCSVITWELGTNATADKDQIFVNGIESSYKAQGASASARTNGTVQIGGGSNLSGSWLFAQESGVLAFNRKLTASEVLSITNILRDYGRTIGLPDVPAVTNSSTSSVVCGVDSITFGQGVTNSYCTSTLLTLNETATITRTPAVQGQAMTAAAAHLISTFHPYFAANGLHNTAVLFGCTNDNGFVTASDCVRSTARGVADLHSVGWKVIVMPMLSRTSGDTYKNQINASLRSTCPTFADYCLLDTDSNLYADGAYANATYFQGDGTHPTATGQALLGTYLSNAYNKLYGATAVNPTAISAATYTLTAADSFSMVTANSTLTLPSCLGYSGAWQVKVNPGLTVAIKTANSSQTIDGTDYSSSGLTLAAGSTSNFLVIPGATSTGGCTWSIQ